MQKHFLMTSCSITEEDALWAVGRFQPVNRRVDAQKAEFLFVLHTVQKEAFFIPKSILNLIQLR
jgi:hypothetical protein